MEYRDLGNTGLKVSAVGLGCGTLGDMRPTAAVRLVERALELGVTYFDVARIYKDAELNIGQALAPVRDRVIISTKAIEPTREDAWRQINESLERLRTDHVDNLHMHSVKTPEDIDRRLGPGGSLEALVRAKEQGMAHHIGVTSHRSALLIEAIKRFNFEVILVPLNIIEREPLDELIPLCRRQGIGVTIMKPLATGLLPGGLAVKWLLNQPIASCVPGPTTLAELEENTSVGNGDYRLSTAEQARVEELRQEWAHSRCRICNLCLPCPTGLNIGFTLGSDGMYNHYRTMGHHAFRSFNWTRSVIEADLKLREERIAQITACTNCGECEPRCPYSLPIVDMLHRMLPPMRDMADIYHEILARPE